MVLKIKQLNDTKMFYRVFNLEILLPLLSFQ